MSGCPAAERSTARTVAAMSAAPMPLPMASASETWSPPSVVYQSKKSPPTLREGRHAPATS